MKIKEKRRKTRALYVSEDLQIRLAIYAANKDEFIQDIVTDTIMRGIPELVNIEIPPRVIRN